VPNTLQFLILTLAVFRIARLLIEDTILEPVRERTVYKLDPKNLVRELFECAWCVGFWLAVFATIAWAMWPDQTGWVALPLAISAGVGLIASNSR